jgi:hypothetical protein
MLLSDTSRRQLSSRPEDHFIHQEANIGVENMQVKKNCCLLIDLHSETWVQKMKYSLLIDLHSETRVHKTR